MTRDACKAEVAYSVDTHGHALLRVHAIPSGFFYLLNGCIRVEHQLPTVASNLYSVYVNDIRIELSS